MAATKAKKKRKPNPVTKRATAKRVYNSSAAGPAKRRRRPVAKKNPLIIYRTKRKNPADSGEIVDFVLAGTGIGVVQPWLARMVSSFGIPGQYVTPVSTAATGVGLWWLSGMFKASKRFARPALLLGISTGVVAIIAPMVRRWIMPSGGGAQMPANGPAGRRMNGPAGIGAWNGQPMALPAPMSQPVKAASKGPAGIGVFPTPAGRFSRR